MAPITPCGSKTLPMRFTPIHLLLVGLIGSNAIAQSAKPATNNTPNVSHSAAIAAIKKLGGSVKIDTESPDRPVIRVDLDGYGKVTDADLVYLKELTSLERLYLSSSKITDVGLVHLKGLTNLVSLGLSGGQIHGYRAAAPEGAGKAPIAGPLLHQNH